MSAAWSAGARFLTNDDAGCIITVREFTSEHLTGRLVSIGTEDGIPILTVTGFDYSATTGLHPVLRRYPMRLNERVGVDTLTAARIAARLKQNATAEEADK